jgi:hypothetical protein
VKVFALMAFGHYGGGMAIIAAETAEEAKGIGASIHDKMWGTDYREPYRIEELPLQAAEAGVIVHHETGE